MKFLFDLGGKKMLMSYAQLEAMMAVLGTCEILEERHIGDGKGTHGYNNNYVTDINPLPVEGWFHPTLLEDHYYDAIKLAQKLRAKA
jgi:hypothetical protein